MCICDKRSLDGAGNLNWHGYVMIYGLASGKKPVIWSIPSVNERPIKYAIFGDLKYYCRHCSSTRTCLTEEEFIKLRHIAIYSLDPNNDIKMFLKTLPLTGFAQ